MEGEPGFRTDLYAGAADFYDRFRPPYPAALLDHLCRRAAVDGRGRLLDVACGPGTVALALHDRFAEVCGLDQEPRMIEHAAAAAAARGARGARWVVGRAEDFDPGTAYDVVTIGTAFHRLDRARVAGRARRWLRPGGHLALLWSDTPMNGAAPWAAALADALVEWMARAGATARLPAGLEERFARVPHVEVLTRAGFTFVGRHEAEVEHEWTAPRLIGFVYSTSLLPHAALGDLAADFERDLTARVLAIEPAGVLRGPTSFAYDLLRAPGA